MVAAWEPEQGIYATFCGLGFAVCYIPLYWHVKAWNVGTMLWIFWAGTGCLIYFINAIIWRNNVINVAPVWCDIATRFLHVQPIGICLSSALINYRLNTLSKLKAIHTESDKRRMDIIEFSIGLGVPTVFMGLYWFIQGHRFDIYEGLGCYPTTPFTTVWLGTFAIWPTITMIVSACFGVSSIINFLNHRRQTEDILNDSEQNITSYRYFRLMVFSSIDVLYLLPVNLVILFLSSSIKFYPWKSLADLHFGFSAVDLVPVFEWQHSQASYVQVLIPPVTSIFSSFVFFFVFGLAKEARVHYRKLFDTTCTWCMQLKGRVTEGTTLISREEPKSRGLGGILTHMTMPSFIQRVPPAQKPSRRHRKNSLSSTLSVSIVVEDFTVYDDPELGHPLKTVEAAYRPHEQTTSTTTSQMAEIAYPSPPLLPPGLPSAHRPKLPSLVGSPIHRTPPRHSFHGPKSVLSSTNSLDNL